MLVTALNPTIGYDRAAEVVKEAAATGRPLEDIVVDKGWMEKGRQVGTSGVAVKPRVYLAVGVSGSFQHMGGVKGGPFVAAINKDPAAPVFGGRSPNRAVPTRSIVAPSCTAASRSPSYSSPMRWASTSVSVSEAST